MLIPIRTHNKGKRERESYDNHDLGTQSGIETLRISNELDVISSQMTERCRPPQK